MILMILGGVWTIARTTAAPAAQLSANEIFLFDTRADLELMADIVFEGPQRPEGWTGNVDVAAVNFTIDLWYDNELIADRVFGAGVRPPEWISSTVAAAGILARNVRHDLELTADEVFGLNERPDGWRGAAPILRCSRDLQNTVALLGTAYGIFPQTPESVIDYCRSVRVELEDDLVGLLLANPDQAAQFNDLQALFGAVRGDLERLQDELYGVGIRPTAFGYPPFEAVNRDASTPSFVTDLVRDLDLAADAQLGVGARPTGYVTPNANLDPLNYLTVRRNLELLTDATYGEDRRPAGWQGVNPLERCDPVLRILSFLVQSAYNFDPGSVDSVTPGYCTRLSNAVNTIVENPPVIDVAAVVNEQRTNGTSNFAFTYLDVAATQYMGIMPGGIPFRAIYRHYGRSNMMLVSGDNFALYIDRRFTDFSETSFRSLPTTENVTPLTFCDAGWCNGPGPTPTPTGGSPLILVLINTTPIATPDTATINSQKQLVSWNYIRVTYVQDDLQNRVAQVGLEICAQPAQGATACEPVTGAFDNTSNTPIPQVGDINGVPVYQFRYGYSTDVLIESANRYSVDLWISDPTIR